MARATVQSPDSADRELLGVMEWLWQWQGEPPRITDEEWSTIVATAATAADTVDRLDGS